MSKHGILLFITILMNVNVTIGSEKRPTFFQNIALFFSRPKAFDNKFDTQINNNSFSQLLRPPVFVSGDIYNIQKTIHIKEITPGETVDHGTINEIFEQEYQRRRSEEEAKRMFFHNLRRNNKFLSEEERSDLRRGPKMYRLNEHLDQFVQENNALFCPKINTIFVGSTDCKYCYSNEK